MDTLSFPIAGPYVGPEISASPARTPWASGSGLKTIIIVCLFILLGVNIIAILAHTTTFATSAAAATVRDLTAKVVNLLGLTTAGAVATATELDKEIEASLNAVGGAASAVGAISVPSPDSSMESSVQCRGKKGWCYVGEEGGNRSCLEVGANNYCQSGNVYPSRDICINPSLRK
jgi:hypothetical protein